MARDPYQVVLADLRAKRDDIDKLIHTLEAYRPAAAPTSASGLNALKQTDGVGPLYGLSIVDAAKTVLRDRGRPLPVADIVTGLRDGGHVMNSEDPSNTVSSVLNRAFHQGSGVVRVGRGIWALVEPSAEPDSEPRVTTQEATTRPTPPSPRQPPLPSWASTTSETPRSLGEELADDDIPF